MKQSTRFAVFERAETTPAITVATPQ